MRDPAFQRTRLEQKVGQLKEQFQALFDLDMPFTRDFVWGGVYGENDDGLPYIGPHPDFSLAYFALGYGGYGTTTLPY